MIGKLTLRLCDMIKYEYHLIYVGKEAILLIPHKSSSLLMCSSSSSWNPVLPILVSKNSSYDLMHVLAWSVPNRRYTDKNRPLTTIKHTLHNSHNQDNDTKPQENSNPSSKLATDFLNIVKSYWVCIRITRDCDSKWLRAALTVGFRLGCLEK